MLSICIPSLGTLMGKLVFGYGNQVLCLSRMLSICIPTLSNLQRKNGIMMFQGIGNAIRLVGIVQYCVPQKFVSFFDIWYRKYAAHQNQKLVSPHKMIPKVGS